MESMHMKFFINNSVTPKHWVGHFVFFVVVIFGLTVNPVKGEDVALSNLPEVIRKAADSAVPNAKWNKAVKETDGKDNWYDIEGVDSKGRYVCVTVEPNGDIEEIETEINLQDTPKKIMTALRDRLPNFKISAVYEIRDDEKKILRYDFEGRRLKDKKDVIVSFSGDAKFIKIND